MGGCSGWKKVEITKPSVPAEEAMGGIQIQTSLAVPEILQLCVSEAASLPFLLDQVTSSIEVTLGLV